MPLCSLHLLALHPSTTLPQFISSLHAWSIKPLTVAKVIRWIIVPEHIDTADLLSPSHLYDLLLVLPGNSSSLPGPLAAKVNAHYTLQVGIPRRLLQDFSKKNKSLLHPSSTSKIPALTGALANDPVIDQKSSQTLTLSPDLLTWIDDFKKTSTGRGAVSMLNLLSFRPGMKGDYLEYGKAFASSIGSKRGGDAKLVGHVVYPDTNSGSSSSGNCSTEERRKKQAQQATKWDEFALAHYPSIEHFADMLGSRDYQEVNQKYRVPALRDTCILCTSEIEVEDLMEKERKQKGKAKL